MLERRISAYRFWSFSGVGLFAGFIVGTLIITLTASVEYRMSLDSKYKVAFLLSAGGAEESVLNEYNSETEAILAGRQDGFFIRKMNKSKEGVTLEKIVAKEKIAREIIENRIFKESDQRLFDLPTEIVQLAKSGHWERVREKEDFLAVLKGVLEKGEKVSVAEYEGFLSVGLAILILIATVQICGFLSLCLFSVDHNWSWFDFDFDWGQFWIYPSLFVLFVPGVLPVIAATLFFKLLSPSFWRKRRQRGQDKKKSFNPNSFKFDFSDTKESKLALERLQKRLREKSNA